MSRHEQPQAPLKLTKAEIIAKRTPEGGYTRETLAEWGVPWPPPKGWIFKLLRGEPILTREEQKAAAKEDRKFWEALRRGGQRASYQRGSTLYERRPDDKPSERITYLDRTNDTRPLMSGRLRIPDGLRSVGNLYGDSVLMANLGPGKPFALEAVDGGKHASGGVSLRMIHAAHLATMAQECMAQMPPLRYRCTVKAQHGEHTPITPRKLTDSICAYGMGIEEIALRNGWWVQGPKMPRVPRRQKALLTDALEYILGEIDEVWGQHGIDARGRLGVVEPR